MFYKAALDINENNAPLNSRFMSCVRFVADEVTPAVFYLNKEWSKRETLKQIGIDVTQIPVSLKDLLEEHDLTLGKDSSLDMPILVYLREGSWKQTPDPETGRLTGLAVPKRELVLSSSEVVHKAHLIDSGLNAQTAILCLAAVGLDIMLPNVSFDLLADEEIERVKETLKEERHNYLSVAANLADQSFHGLQDGDYNEVIRWAENEVALKLAPKARILEEAVSSQAARKLKQAGYSFWKDGVPAIGSAYFSGGLATAGAASAHAALKSLINGIDSYRGERLIPEVAYAMKLRRVLHE